METGRLRDCEEQKPEATLTAERKGGLDVRKHFAKLRRIASLCVCLQRASTLISAVSARWDGKVKNRESPLHEEWCEVRLGAPCFTSFHISKLSHRKPLSSHRLTANLWQRERENSTLTISTICLEVGSCEREVSRSDEGGARVDKTEGSEGEEGEGVQRGKEWCV